MSEDRTREPSKLRRQEARDRGQVAHSPELTAAAGFLAASAALTVWGEGMTTSLLGLVSRPLVDAPVLSADPAEIVSRVRLDALGVAGPLIGILLAFATAALATHLAQVGVLIAPGRLAPDPSRLWSFGRGVGLGSRTTNGVWAVVKTAAVVVIAGWVGRVYWLEIQRAGALSLPSTAIVAGGVLRHVAVALGTALLALGGVDYWLQRHRFEATRRITPEEHREDLRAMEGDPALRARRRHVAQAWRDD